MVLMMVAYVSSFGLFCCCGPSTDLACGGKRPSFTQCEFGAEILQIVFGLGQWAGLA